MESRSAFYMYLSDDKEHGKIPNNLLLATKKKRQLLVMEVLESLEVSSFFKRLEMWKMCAYGHIRELSVSVIQGDHTRKRGGCTSSRYT